MSKITHIDIPSTSAALDQLHVLINDYNMSLTAMKHKAEEHDGCWGDDEAGQAFAEDYVEKARDLLKTATDDLDFLRQFEQFFREAVEAFKHIDEGAGQYLSYKDA